MPIYIWEGKVLFREAFGSKIAISNACCCMLESPSPSPSPSPEIFTCPDPPDIASTLRFEVISANCADSWFNNPNGNSTIITMSNIGGTTWDGSTGTWDMLQYWYEHAALGNTWRYGLYATIWCDWNPNTGILEWYLQFNILCRGIAPDTWMGFHTFTLFIGQELPATFDININTDTGFGYNHSQSGLYSAAENSIVAQCAPYTIQARITIN